MHFGSVHAYLFLSRSKVIKGVKRSILLKMLKISQNWLYLSLMKTDIAQYCYSDTTLMVEQVYDSLDPKGQSSRSKVKIYIQAPIVLKFVRNNLCDIVNTEQVQVTPSVTQGSRNRGQKVKLPTYAWIELKLAYNDPRDVVDT